MLLLTLGLALGCNSSSNQSSSAANENSDTSSNADAKALSASRGSPIKGCYMAVLGKDSLHLAITAVNGKSVAGSLTLNFAEKDRSTGTFNGEYIDGVLNAIYKFNAEGTTSQRQVIFKKVDGGFIEGFGEIAMVDGIEMLSKPNEVEFDQRNVFKYTTDCL